MNPELRQLQEQLKLIEDQVSGLKAAFNSLSNNATIPFDIGEAFKTRVLTNITPLSISSKDADSEDESITVGLNTTIVLGDPDGFLQVTINDVIYYIPYFNS